MIDIRKYQDKTFPGESLITEFVIETHEDYFWWFMSNDDPSLQEMKERVLEIPFMLKHKYGIILIDEDNVNKITFRSRVMGR